MEIITPELLDEIKAAFWATFHQRGELFFDYLSSKEDNHDCTKGYWAEFVEQLEKKNLLSKV